MRRALQVLAGVVVSAAALWLTLRGKDLGAIWAALREADYRNLAPYLALLLVIHVVRTVRWGLLLRPVAALPFARLNAVTAVGFMALMLLPLFAHPERCQEFERPGRAAEIVRLGASLQLNVGALCGVYGKTSRRLSERFLDEGLYAVAATDLHRADGAHEWLDEALAALEKRAGTAGLERLMAENPRRILAGEELAP